MQPLFFYNLPMNNHERQFDKPDLSENTTEHLIAVGKAVPETMTVNVHYSEEKEEADDPKLRFSDSSTDFMRPMEDEDLIFGVVSPKVRAVREGDNYTSRSFVPETSLDEEIEDKLENEFKTKYNRYLWGSVILGAVFLAEMIIFTLMLTE